MNTIVTSHKMLMAAAMLAALPTPIMAQAWIGQVVGDMMAQQAAAQAEYACMTGTPMVDKEVTEARTPSLAAMDRYWAAVQPGGTGDVTGAFHLDKKARWTHGTTVLTMTGLNAVRDPIIVAGGVPAPQPDAFFRAGDGQSARAHWTVRTAAGKRVGTYVAHFTRRSGDWRLGELTLHDAGTWVDPLVQYCHKPDDVLPFRLKNAESNLAYAQKREVKGEAKLAKAEAASAKPKPAPEAAVKLAKARAELEERRTALAKAREADAAARADAAAAEQARKAGQAALAAEIAG